MSSAGPFAPPILTVQGDVLLARIVNRNTVGAVVTPPARWTLIRSDQSASQIKAWVFYKVAGSAEPASYAFGIDLASYIAGSIVAFSGGDNANSIDAQSGQRNGLTSSFDTPAITTTTSNGVAVWFGSQIWTGAACPASPIVPPSGFTEPFDTCLVSSSTGLLFDAAYKELGGAGLQPVFNGSSPCAETNIAQVVAPRAANAPACTVGDTFSTTVTTVGTVASPAIVEPSGLALSRLTPGVLYVHNEDTTAIVAISTTDASTRGSFNVGNVTPADWEDIATGPCPTGKSISSAISAGSARTSPRSYRRTEIRTSPSATASAIHPCANRFLLRTYYKVYEYRAAAGAASETAFAVTPVSLTDTVEGQGEAIEYEASGAGYFTMSESPSPFKLKYTSRDCSSLKRAIRVP